MPTTIDSAGITFNDATSFTSAVLAANSVGATQITNGSVTAAKLGTTEQKQICKAWVNFDGTTSPGTINSSYNVSSVSKTGTGRYIVNLTTGMSNSNFTTFSSSEVASTLARNIVSGSIPLTTTSVSVVVEDSGGTAQDTVPISVAVFGN
jgi:hypothetical protein